MTPREADSPDAASSIAAAPVFALVAGEASGDQLGAGLIAALRERYPDARFVGVGGPRMIEAGLEAWYPAEKLAVMGLVEVLRHLPELLRIRADLLRRIAACRSRRVAQPPVVGGALEPVADALDELPLIVLRKADAAIEPWRNRAHRSRRVERRQHHRLRDALALVLSEDGDRPHRATQGGKPHSSSKSPLRLHHVPRRHVEQRPAVNLHMFSD